MSTRHRHLIVWSFTLAAFALAGIGLSAPAASAVELARLECRENATGRVFADLRISYRVGAVAGGKQQWTVGGYTLDIVDGSAPKTVRATITFEAGNVKKSRAVSARPGRPTALPWRVSAPSGSEARGFAATMSVAKTRYTCRSVA
jgi:hypothetical protein